jgi:hypothetical protein
MAMRVTVCENTKTGTTHGQAFSLAYNAPTNYACGQYAALRTFLPTDVLLGHYTDWRDRVTCKRCLRALERMEAKRDGKAG